MPLSEAVAVAEIQVCEHQPHEDIDTLCGLAEQAQQFSPIVGLESLDKHLWPGRTLLQPECLLLDVTGVAPLFGGEDKLLEAATQWLNAQHYVARLAIAGSIGAAWAMANYGIPRNDRSVQTPTSASCLTPPGSDREHLARLPVEALRIERSVATALRKLGVRLIEELWELPRAGLATRLGEHLMMRWDQALGTLDEPIATLHESPEWQVEQTLEYATDNRETIIEVVRRLCRRLAERLGRQNRGALRIVCRLDMVESVSLVIQLGLYRATDDAEHLQALLTGQLEQQLQMRATAALWRACIQATLVAPLVWQQTELFDTEPVGQRQQLARLVDNLSCRLGRKQVLQVNVERISQPELAYSLAPMTGRRVDGSEQSTVRKLSSRMARQRAEPSAEDPLRRPLQLFTPPIAVNVIAMSGAPPTQMTFRNQLHQVRKYWGPERLEGGWWRGPSYRRDYYRIESADGSWWWIYQDLSNGQWYMHGMFD